MPNAGMPQLDFSTFPTQLFWLAVTFITLYLLMRWLALPRVAAMIKARRDQLDADLARAEQLKAEAEDVLTAYQQTLATARAQAQAAVKQTTDRLAAEAAERQRQLNEALSRQITAAEREIAAAKQRVAAELHDIAVDIARSVTEKLTGRPADVTSVAAAVDRAMAEHARR
jgi:F-type H+-transporting ATPase subunit b